ARVLAELLMKNQVSNLSDRIDWAFQLLIGRKAREDEKRVLENQFREELKSWRNADPADMEKLLTVGEYPYDRSLDKSDLIAYTLITSTIMNYDEFVMKR
ncbi:MAG: hypothetical protein OEM26_03565, partial [Saprospiraceae bacterium]|nr:hypothetical protein [Saprospiraceae bacterium]